MDLDLIRPSDEHTATAVPHRSVRRPLDKEGVTEAIHDALRGKVRQAAVRGAEPTAAILDAQTVKTSGNVPEHSQSIDAGKKIKGGKRHVATDVPGLLLVVL